MFWSFRFNRSSRCSVTASGSLITALMVALALAPLTTVAEVGGNSSTISGTVTDPSGAVIPGATVEIQNLISHLNRTTTTDAAGKFSFPNLPLNPYHLTVNLSGFPPYVQDVDVRSVVPMDLKITMKISANAENVTVQAEAGDLVESDPTFHTDVDRSLF